MDAWQIWLVVAVTLFIIEIFTPAFLAACIGIGAIFGAILAALGFGLNAQLIFFAMGVLASFFLIRPFMLRYVHSKDKLIKTNADAIVGRVARVNVTINNKAGQGRVTLDGDDWRAISVDDSVIEQGEQVEIVKLDITVLTVRVLASE